MNPLPIILKDQYLLLSFQRFKPNIAEYGAWYLSFGLFTAWLAGVGRYWDNPKADLWQYFGLGSVAYCIFLSAVVFIIIYPLKPNNWSYKNVLIFISLTSLPAVLYAIPVEKLTTLEVAQRLNVSFLLVVATWRVILFVLYLKRSAGLTGPQIFVAAFLPIVLIINVLAMLNLEHVVFRIMAGITEEERSGNDLAYQVLLMITVLSYSLLPFLLVGYGWFIYKVRRYSNSETM